jgi:nucleoside-diphosphate-sugar epimerase|tara:strand:- start:1706 stop:3586 length:1881 start_codon:yes stop_codon:yes gene_type:complete
MEKKDKNKKLRQDPKRKVLVIGAGIHGITMAVELAKNGHQVTIIDKNEDMLEGSSFATHNRIHLGYHYPRSKETAEECRRGYYYFVKHLKDCLIFPDFYYVIAKKNSNVTAKQYKGAMENLSLECNSVWPDEKFLNREKIEDSFKVKEACFDLWKIRDKYKKKFKEHGVKEIHNFDVQNASISAKNKIKLFSNSSDIEINTDLIINCTYTSSNNIQKAFSVFEDMTPYKIEDTEVAVVESNEKIPALTVMDGPFITILPYAGKENHYLVYDKINSVIKQEYSVMANPLKTSKTNWNKMLEHGLQYYPFFKNLKYKYSLYGNRPISVKAKDDGRATKIVKHEYPIDFYSVFEGKFVSAPLVSQRMLKLINRKKNALIGHTGFIGSNLKKDFLFDDFYNSSNITDIEDKEYEIVMSCANSSAIWKVNKNPEEDLKNITNFIEHIKKVKTKNFVLISTIDVYENPVDVYENSEFGNLENYPYGKHRLYLENFVRKNFPNHLIIRLPVTYGNNFKKNVIYDVLNNKDLDKINTSASLQFYNVKNLMKDITLALINNIRILNISTEPILVKDLYKEIFDLDLDNPSKGNRRYDMKTLHAGLFGKKKDYAYNKIEILNELKQFKMEYEYKRI